MAYYHYSDDPLTPKIHNGDSTTKYVPFKLFAKIVPDKLGRRWVRVRDLQKLASFIETDIIDNIDEINLAEPVAFTPQYGNNPGRVTVIGFMAVDSDQYPNESPTTQARIIHSGTIMGQKTQVVSGPTGGSTSWGQDIKEAVRTQVKFLKNTIESAVDGINIYFIEYNGVKFGNGHMSFPL